MNTHIAPLIRIFLRYVVGAVIAGAGPLAEQLAADQDFVMLTAAAVAALVEGVYLLAKRNGWST